MTLDQIVAAYIRQHRPCAQAEIRFFERLPNLAEAVSHAVWPRGRKHAHQYLIPPALLEKAARQLHGIRPDLAQAGNFASLYGLVERETGSIRGIGELAVYDMAHRIGMHLSKAPALVYLHRGVRKGAAILGFRGKALDPKLLPPAFSRLTAAEIEDCLCIYKGALAGGPSPRACTATVHCRSAPHARSRC